MQNNKIKITIDYFTIAFICIIVILSNDSKYIAAILCTICHEAGHIAVMRSCGCEKINVKVNLFNIAIADPKRGVRPYKQDIAIICAGPLVNLVMFVVFGIINIFWKSVFIRNIVFISLVLCCFNLLPIESTDGGQLLKIVLEEKFTPQTVRVIMTVLSVIFIIPLSCLSFYVLLQSRYNFTLLFTVIYFCFVTVMNFV